MKEQTKKRVGRPRGRNFEVVSVAVDPLLRDSYMERLESTGGTVSAALRPIIEQAMRQVLGLTEKRQEFEALADSGGVPFIVEVHNEKTANH